MLEQLFWTGARGNEEYAQYAAALTPAYAITTLPERMLGLDLWTDNRRRRVIAARSYSGHYTPPMPKVNPFPTVALHVPFINYSRVAEAVLTDSGGANIIAPEP
jgi:hypothetical protein